jgi:hypothetical protein
MKITHASSFGAGKGGDSVGDIVGDDEYRRWRQVLVIILFFFSHLGLQLTLKVGAIQRHANAPASKQNVVVEVDVFFLAMVAQLGVGGCGAVHDGDTGVLNVVQLEVENGEERTRGEDGEAPVEEEPVGEENRLVIGRPGTHRGRRSLTSEPQVGHK